MQCRRLKRLNLTPWLPRNRRPSSFTRRPSHLYLLVLTVVYDKMEPYMTHNRRNGLRLVVSRNRLYL